MIPPFTNTNKNSHVTNTWQCWHFSIVLNQKKKSFYQPASSWKKIWVLHKNLLKILIKRMRLKWLSLVHQQGYEKMLNSFTSMKMAVSMNAVIHTTCLQLGNLGKYRCFHYNWTLLTWLASYYRSSVSKQTSLGGKNQIF